MPIPMLQAIPAKYASACAFCGEILDVRDRGVYQRTSGWVMNRDGGGGHAVSLPEREPRWAHGICIERQRHGTFGQTPLFGEAG